MDEQNIPIDIHSNKLLDWLVSRRHVIKDWPNNIIKVREKINNAIQDMPAHDGIVELISGQQINYFHCLKIVDILKETEADTKNLFGRYGSQRMKDWQDLLASYQKDNLYLAELAQMLIRNVSFEIPSLRKQVLKLEQAQLDCEKKIKDYVKNECYILKEFQSSCEQLGIPGKDIKNELIKLVDDLPNINEKSASKIKMTDPAIKLYSAFKKFLSGKSQEVLPTLTYLIKMGNSTTYEYKYGKKPLSIEVTEDVMTHGAQKVYSNSEIDFGADIDFGDAEVNELIEFGNITPSNENIDWSMNTDEEFEIIEHSDTNSSENILEINENDVGDVAKGSDSLTILDNPETRDDIVNDLLELEAFLKMRLFEMSNESDLLSMSQMQDAPSILQLQTIESLTTLYNNVSNAIIALTNKRIQHLYNIKHSPNYVDILTSNLNQKLSVIDRMKTNKTSLELKIEESREEMKIIEIEIGMFVERTKKLQENIQQDISNKYKGRVVNIVGGVNAL